MARPKTTMQMRRTMHKQQESPPGILEMSGKHCIFPSILV